MATDAPLDPFGQGRGVSVPEVTCGTCRHWTERSSERGTGDCAVAAAWETKYPFILTALVYVDETCDMHNKDLE